MKSMLSDLDFSNVKLEPGDKTKLLTGGRNAAVELIRRHEDNLTKALEAALSLALAQNVYITCVPEHEADEAMAELNHRQTLLETALEPFKVVGGDGKETLK